MRSLPAPLHSGTLVSRIFNVCRASHIYGLAAFAMTAWAPPCSAQGIISTIAGDGPYNVSAISAGIPRPTAVVSHNSDLFVLSADTGRIYRVRSSQLSLVAGSCSAPDSTGQTLALQACLAGASGIATNSTGDLFVADPIRNVVWRIDQQSNVITIVAGMLNSFSYSGDGGPATEAGLGQPQGVAVDAVGNVYIADTNSNRIRKVHASTRQITTIAGTGSPGYNGDGIIATTASLNRPADVAVDGNSNIFVADSLNRMVRRIDSSTERISTIFAPSATTGNVIGITVDPSGTCYFTVRSPTNNAVYRIDGGTLAISVVGGSGSVGFFGDGGPSTAASLFLDTSKSGLGAC